MPEDSNTPPANPDLDVTLATDAGAVADGRTLDLPTEQITVSPAVPEIILNGQSYQEALTTWTRMASRDTRPEALATGDTYNGRYEILGVLGSGGMGVVYHAQDTLAKRPCALKIANPQMFTESAGRLRFREEFQAMAALKHPNLPAVHDFGEATDGTPFMVMDYVPGAPCADAVPLALPRFYAWFVQLLRALSFIHERGFLHRDIKPANAMASVDDAGQERIVLLDFGLMERIGAASDKRVCGTPHFMAPEIVDGRPLDARTDLYALGISAYVLLTGRPPFDAGQIRDVFELHNSAPRPRVRETYAAIPLALDDLLARLIASQPGERPDSADDVLRELSNLTEHVHASDLDARRAYLHVGELVGREEQTATLRQALADTAAGSSRLVFVAGDPGTGKSRLLEQFVIDAMTRGFAVAGASALREDRSPYQALRGILSGLLPVARRSGSHPADNAGWRRVQPPDGLLVATGDSVEAESPADERSLLIDGMTGWLKDLAATQPLAVIIDDLQWCDDGTSQIVAALAIEKIPGLMLVGAFRPTELPITWDLPGWQRRVGSLEIHVNPLTGSEFRDLIDGLLGRHGLSDGFIAQLETLTSGTPFFTIELLRSLIDRDALVRRDGAWSQLQQDFQLPSSLQDILADRLASLSEDGRRTAQLLAVAGGRLELTGLAALLEIPDDRLFAALDDLYRQHLLRRQKNVLSLVHDHVRAAVDGSLADDQRRDLHQRLGDWLAERMPLDHPDRQATLGHHFSRGRDVLRGIDLLEAAGRAAFAQEQIGAARDLLIAAESLLEPNAHEPATYERLYDVRKMLGMVCMTDDYSHGVACSEWVYQHALKRGVLRRIPILGKVLPPPLPYAYALGINLPLAFLRNGRKALAQFRRDLTDAFMATGYMTNGLSSLGKLTSARERAERLRALTFTSRGIGEAFIVIASTMSRNHQDGPGAYREHSRLRLILQTPLARPIPLYHRTLMVGVTHYVLALDSALQVHPDFAHDFQISDRFARHHDHGFLQQLNKHAAIEHAVQRGDMHAATRHEEDFLHVLQRLGGQARQREWLIDFAMGRLEIDCARLDRATLRMERLRNDGPGYFTEGFGSLLHAMLLRAWNQPEAAIEAARRALAIARDPEVRATLFEFRVLATLADIYLDLDRIPEVEAALSGMRKYAGHPGHRTRWFPLELTLRRIRLLLREQPRIALNVTRQALAVADAIDSPRQQADLRQLLADCMTALDMETNEIASLRRQAATMHESLGNTVAARLLK